MADCYNCEELTPHESLGSRCLPPRISGFAEIALVLCDADITDPSDGTEINALIAADLVRLIEEVMFGFDSGEPFTIPRVTSCGSERTLYVTYTGTLKDWAWSQNNMTLYTQLIAGYNVKGIIARQCVQEGYDDTSLYLNGEVTFSGSPIAPDNIDETSRFELTWSFRGTPQIIATPQGVFGN